MKDKQLKKEVEGFVESYPFDITVRIASEKLTDDSYVYNVILNDGESRITMGAKDLESARHIAETLARNTVDVIYDDNFEEPDDTNQ